jgi:hypothetical protein
LTKLEQHTYVHDPTVDVAKLLQTEKPRAMGRVIEGEALYRLAMTHSSVLTPID